MANSYNLNSKNETKGSRFWRIALRHILPLVLAWIIGAVLSVHQGQDISWDLLNYHYYDGYAIIHDLEHKDIAVAGAQTYWNPAVDVVNYLIISHVKPIVAGEILGAIQGFNLFLVYEISIKLLRRFLKRKSLYISSLLIAIVSFLASVNLGELGTSMVDNTTTILVLLSLLLFITSLDPLTGIRTHVRKRGLMRIGAYILMGAAVALKLTNAPFAIALILIDIFNYSSARQFLFRFGSNLGGLVAGFAIGGGPWYYYLWKNFQSPIFPLYNKIFHSPYFPNTNINIVANFFPRGWLQTLFYPFYFTRTSSLSAGVNFRDPRLAVLYVLLIVLLITWFLRKRIPRLKKTPLLRKEMLLLLAFVIISYVLWEKEFSNLRYIMPLELLAVPLIVALLFSLLPARKLAVFFCIATVIFIAATTTSMSWGRIPWEQSYFGVRLPTFARSPATVLMAGNAPLGFIATFLPSSDHIIHAESVVSPLGANTRLQQLMRTDISKAEKDHVHFLGIETFGNLLSQQKSFASFGFKPSICVPIQNFYQASYKVCRLVSTR